MIFRKDILRFWAVFSVILAMALGIITLVHRWHRVFPSGEVSDIYAKYSAREDIAASFVKNYRVNDSIYIDVTLLETKDTNEWEELCDDFNIAPFKDLPLDFRESLTESNSYSLRVIKDSTDIDSCAGYRRYVIIFSYNKMSMCVFHNVNDNQFDALIEKKTNGVSDKL